MPPWADPRLKGDVPGDDVRWGSTQFRKMRQHRDFKIQERPGFLCLDPLGLIAPVVLPAKTILQDLCRQKYTWDESLPDDVIKEWTKWTTIATEFGVDRYVKTEEFGTPVFAQLHHFADASEDAYGTTSYLVLRSSTGEILMMAKARVVPLKSAILEHSQASQWRYVNTSLNPADHGLSKHS